MVSTTTMRTVQFSKHSGKDQKTKRQYPSCVKMRKQRSFGPEAEVLLDMTIEEDEWLESKGQQKFKRLHQKA